MRPDLVFLRGGAVWGVADVKYKLSQDAEARQADAYQLLAYCTALGLSAGTLLYAGDDDRTDVRTYHVRGTPIRLHVLPVQLAGGLAALDAEVHRLSMWVLRSTVTGWPGEEPLQDRTSLQTAPA